MKDIKSIEIKLKDSLKESSNMIYNLANINCKNGIVDENCVWYHSIWQYLRMLDVVSSPTWHDKFYNFQLNNVLQRDNLNILISGTADYSILAYVISIMKKNKKHANIYVLDTCKTPLLACEWFAKKENVKITCINENILNYNNNEFFDVICTDAFLTRFKDEFANLVIDKWYNLLKIDGRIITTIRIHNSNEKSSDKNLEKFIQKVKDRYSLYKNYIEISYDELIEKAKEYAQKMKSNNIGNKEEILERFKKFNIEYEIKIVSGELSETEYIELVAKKKGEKSDE